MGRVGPDVQQARGLGLWIAAHAGVWSSNVCELTVIRWCTYVYVMKGHRCHSTTRTWS